MTIPSPRLDKQRPIKVQAQLRISGLPDTIKLKETLKQYNLKKKSKRKKEGQIELITCNDSIHK